MLGLRAIARPGRIRLAIIHRAIAVTKEITRQQANRSKRSRGGRISVVLRCVSLRLRPLRRAWAGHAIGPARDKLAVASHGKRQEKE